MVREARVGVREVRLCGAGKATPISVSFRHGDGEARRGGFWQAWFI